MGKVNKKSNSSAAVTGSMEPSSSHAPQIQTRLDTYIKAVGDRVITERRRLKISRRILAERSGVSQRTIVLLETGEGNISLALLCRIAWALGHTVEWFLNTEDQSKKEALRVADYYLGATPIQRQKIQNILASAELLTLKKQRICLIGLRGAGKSTLGKALGKKLSVPFVELNEEVEKISGMSTEELMSLYGTEGYRKLEQQALTNTIETHDKVILAAAGGIVSEENTYSSLLKHFHTIWLKAKPEEHMERVKRQGDVRPMAGNPAAMQELKTILVSRESLYAAADEHIDTSNKTVDFSLQELDEIAASYLSSDSS